MIQITIKKKFVPEKNLLLLSNYFYSIFHKSSENYLIVNYLDIFRNNKESKL